MEGRVRYLNKHLKKYDSKLFCARAGDKIDVYRNVYRQDVYKIGDETLIHLVEVPSHVLSLTEDWTVTGRPVDWGVEPLLQRLRKMDTWNHDSWSEAEAGAERNRALKKRRLKNKLDDIGYEVQPYFKKAADEFNFSNVSKESIFKKLEIKKEI